MTYDEFSDKLKQIKSEFFSVKNKKIETVKELEEYLVERKVRPKSKKLRSLRGLSI